MTLYLSRLTLRRDPDAAALRALIDPAERSRALDAHHRLIWSLFADRPDRTRDFLWRADGKGRFFTLSARPPAPAPLFEPPQIKAFAPDLAAGDRLAFALRANATRSLKTESGARGRRVDVVMHALHDTPGRTALPPGTASQRPARRMGLAQDAAETWMRGQGVNSGFTLDRLEVQDYSVLALPGHRGRREGQPQFGILDLAGGLTVTDPAAFVAALASGFGRAKAFGCGLMLIRRA